MKKTYATSMPNHIGAFLKASKCFAALGLNITRVSYDKAVDRFCAWTAVMPAIEKKCWRCYGSKSPVLTRLPSGCC